MTDSHPENNPMTLEQAIKSLESISADILTGYTDNDADAFAAILAAMEQAKATIAAIAATTTRKLLP